MLKRRKANSSNLAPVCAKTTALLKIETEIKADCNQKLREITLDVQRTQKTLNVLCQSILRTSPYLPGGYRKFPQEHKNQLAKRTTPRRRKRVALTLILGSLLASSVLAGTSFIVSIINSFGIGAINTNLEITKNETATAISDLRLQIADSQETVRNTFATRDSFTARSLSLVTRRQNIDATYSVYVHIAAQSRDSITALIMDLNTLLNGLLTTNLITKADITTINSNLPISTTGRLSNNINDYQVQPAYVQGELSFLITIPIIQPRKQATLFYTVQLPRYTNNTAFFPDCEAKAIMIYNNGRSYSLPNNLELENCLRRPTLCTTSSPTYHSSMRNCLSDAFYGKHPKIQYIPNYSYPQTFTYNIGHYIFYSVSRPTAINFDCRSVDIAGADETKIIQNQGFIENRRYCAYSIGDLSYLPRQEMNSNITHVKESPFRPHEMLQPSNFTFSYPAPDLRPLEPTVSKKPFEYSNTHGIWSHPASYLPIIFTLFIIFIIITAIIYYLRKNRDGPSYMPDPMQLLNWASHRRENKTNHNRTSHASCNPFIKHEQGQHEEEYFEDETNHLGEYYNTPNRPIIRPNTPPKLKRSKSAKHTTKRDLPKVQYRHKKYHTLKGAVPRLPRQISSESLTTPSREYLIFSPKLRPRALFQDERPQDTPMPHVTTIRHNVSLNPNATANENQNAMLQTDISDDDLEIKSLFQKHKE